MNRRLKWSLGLAFVAAVGAVGLAALLVNIIQRQQEGLNPFYRVIDLTDDTADPAVWGSNFPQQYDGYRRTVDQERTRYGGSEARARTPTRADPRSVVAQSRLEEDPRLKTMWAGYAFARDFREERGHAYMLDDQTFTERQQAASQPGTCLHCHASVYNPYKTLGGGDLVKGFEAMNRLPYAEARKLVTHPIACIDCHAPDTMQLRVTRPGFLEGIRVVKAAQGVADYDVNTMATRQEMRSYVCGQCHVEYYFKGPEKRLTYPWANGLKADQILAYYEAQGLSDWTHAGTGAPMLKAQHPEFEMWSQGLHARSGVACADCHMPYQRVGAMKVSDHQVRSPLLNINRACQTCHRWPEDELRDRVFEIQDRTSGLRGQAMNVLVELVADLQAAAGRGASGDDLTEARRRHRRGQFLLDFIEAENSMGFHAGGEAARVLAVAIDELRQGQLAARDADSAGSEPAPMSTAPVFTARALTKVYEMGEVTVQALRGIDFDLDAGEFVVLLGPSGSGKSTLLNILGGLDVPTSGEVVYQDHNLTTAGEAALTGYRRSHVGFVFQFYNLIPSLTARENVALVTEIVENPMTPEEGLALVGLEHRLDHFPAQLSGGEQQRVAIARAIAKRPDVLLCDEPTGALDITTGVVVLEALDRVNRDLGTATVVITHNAAIAGMADRVVRLADGRVAGVERNTTKTAVKDLRW